MYSCYKQVHLYLTSAAFDCQFQIKYHEEFEKKKMGGEAPPQQPSNPSQGIPLATLGKLIFTNQQRQQLF